MPDNIASYREENALDSLLSHAFALSTPIWPLYIKVLLYRSVKMLVGACTRIVTEWLFKFSNIYSIYAYCTTYIYGYIYAYRMRKRPAILA